MIATVLKLKLPSLVLYLGLPMAAFALLSARKQWQRADQADQGAQGEEDVERLLQKLPPEWITEFNHPMRRVGDIDIIVRSPRGRVWAIDVKSHRGTVRVQDGELYRKVAGQDRSFEKNFLTAVKKQAVLLRESQELRYVQPVICFSHAVCFLPEKVQGVQVVSADQLVNYLLSEG